MGSAMNHRGVIAATDGAVKEDGRMGAAYVTLSNKLPARSFVLPGPPSAMLTERSALDQVVTNAPADEVVTDAPAAAAVRIEWICRGRLIQHRCAEDTLAASPRVSSPGKI